MNQNNNAVILECGEILCSLGNLQETVADLFEGFSAISQDSCFGVPVSYAPFKKKSWYDLKENTKILASSIDISNINKEETIFIFCAAKGDISPIEKYYEKKEQSEYLPLLYSQAEYVKNILELENCRTIVISNACTSGATAVEVAWEFLSSGKAQNIIIFGFDAISRFISTGFYSLSALSQTKAKPFDANRDGLTLGDGSCIALLSFRKPYSGDIIVAGGGSSNDANHRTGPSRTGNGLFRAAKMACENANILPEKIGAIKCHGTATKYNDAMEAKAIFSLFGEKIPPCFSVKGAIGHTSGAGSLLEILIAAECIKRRLIPPTVGFQILGVEENIPVSSSSQHILSKTVLCLSAGFGGLNSAVVIMEHS
jgi:3-oxoacyl-[acyl-carrier-protein] synthase-1